jgi:hypothetical protein
VQPGVVERSGDHSSSDSMNYCEAKHRLAKEREQLQLRLRLFEPQVTTSDFVVSTYNRVKSYSLATLPTCGWSGNSKLH